MVLLTIHDSDLRVVGFLDNTKQTTLNYFDDEWIRELASGSSTYTFTTYKKPGLYETYQYLTEQGFISFKYRGKAYLFSIMTVKEDEEYITCYCENLNLELINETVQAYESTEDKTLVQYCNEMELLSFSLLTVGRNEIMDRKRKVSFSSEETKLARLLALVSAFDAELDFSLTLNSDSSVKSFKVNFYEANDGDKKQGVGQFRDDVMLMYRKNFTSITRKIDKTGIYTMLVPKGKKSTDVTTTKRTTVTNSDGTKTVTERASNTSGEIVTTVKTLDSSGKVLASKTTKTTKNEDGSSNKTTTSSADGSTENSSTNVESKQEADGSTTKTTTTNKNGKISKTIVNTRTDGNKTITRTTKPDGSITEKTVTKAGSNSLTQTKVIKAATSSSASNNTETESESDEYFDLSTLSDDWSMKNSDGVVEFYKKGTALYAPIAMQLYPAAFNSGAIDDQWIRRDKEFDAETADELLVLGYEDLENNCYPAVTYDVDGWFDGDIGDTVIVHDDGFRPSLNLRARITYQKMSHSNPTANKTTFSNIKVAMVREVDKLKDIEQQVAEIAEDSEAKLLDFEGIWEKRNAEIDEEIKQWNKAFDDEIEAVNQQMEAQEQAHTEAVDAILAKVNDNKSLATIAKELSAQAQKDAADEVKRAIAKESELKQAIDDTKSQLSNAAANLASAKADLQSSIASTDAKAAQAQRDVAQAKSNLATQASQLSAQATKQDELTKLTTETKQLVDGTKTSLNELTKTVDKNTGNIASVTSRAKTVEDDLSGTKTKLEQVKTTADTTSRKTAELKNSVDGVTNRFDNLKVGSKNLILDSDKLPFKQKGANTTIADEDDYFVLTSTGYTSNTWSGVSWDLSIDSVKAGEEFSLLLPVYLDSSVTNDAGAAITIKNYRLNLNAFTKYISKSNDEWFDLAVTFKTTRDLIFDGKPLYLYFVKNGRLRFKKPTLVRGNIIPLGHSLSDEDFSNRIAEYKRTAEQNYSSLQSTVQTLDGKFTQNKSEATQTADAIKSRLTNLETYKDGETERKNSYFEASKTETAKQIAAERTANTQNYVAKSTYQEDATGVIRRLTATEKVANDTTAKFANYQTANDKRVAALESTTRDANGELTTLSNTVTQTAKETKESISSVSNDLSSVKLDITKNADGLKALATKVETSNNTITQHTSELTALNNQIAAKVSKSDYDKLTGRMSTAETNIQAQAGQIAERLTRTEINTLVDNKGYQTASQVQAVVTRSADSLTQTISQVENKIPTNVIGRNLLKGTKDFTGTWDYNYNPYKVEKWNDRECSIYKSDFIWDGVAQKWMVEAGETYTFSADVASTVNDDLAYIFITMITNWEGTRATVSVPQKQIKAHQYWTRVSCTFTAITAGGIAPRIERSDTNNILYYSALKLEKGSVPTDWSPAPEDVEIKINTVKDTVDSHTRTISEQNKSISQVVQAANGIITMVDDLSANTSSELEATNTQVSQLAGSYAIKNLTSSGTVLNQLNLNKDGSVKIDGNLVQITGNTYIENGIITSAKIKNLEAGKITGMDATFLRGKFDLALIDYLKTKAVSSTNGAFVIDFNGSSIEFRNNLARILRADNNIPWQFIKLDKTTQGGVDTALTVIGSNRSRNLGYSDDYFTGIRIMSSSVKDETQIISDEITFSTGINNNRGWQMKTVVNSDQHGVSLRPFGDVTKSTIEASEFVIKRSDGSTTTLNEVLNAWNGFMSSHGGRYWSQGF